MDEEYDIIVLGTGLVECILSGVFSIEGKKVLHIDKNDYYGGECASLTLDSLYKKFRDGQQPPSEYGRSMDYNIDLIPKFVMARGELVEILLYTGVTRYVEFTQIAGSYVYRDGKIHKVPSNMSEALQCHFVGWFERNTVRKFFKFIEEYSQGYHEGSANSSMTVGEAYTKFGLSQGIQDFIGHGIALYNNEDYVNKPLIEACKHISLYMDSMSAFGQSPYIYPFYGLGELPQGFARLSAIHGGTYMLNRKIRVEYDEDGKFTGVAFEDGERAKAGIIIGDPSYFSERVRKKKEVVRAICILKNPIPNTNESHSVQIIIPQRQLGRRYDIYIACVSSHHKISPPGTYIAFLSTIVETGTPEYELKPAIDLLGRGNIVEMFGYVSDLCEPKDDGRKSHVFISRSYDHSSHFESVCGEVKDLYRRITGKELSIKKREIHDEL